MPNIKLQSSDNEVFMMDVEAARKSITLKIMMEDLGIDESEEEVIPIPNVHSVIMKKVIIWCNRYKNVEYIDVDDGRDRMSKDFSEWDAEFLKVDQAILMEIISAANYLDIRDLLDICCLAVAKMIKGRTPEEIRRVFNIEKDVPTKEETKNAMKFIRNICQ